MNYNANRLMIAFVLPAIALLSGCPGGDHSSAEDKWIKTEVIDSTRLVGLDGNTGLLFDILTGESTGLDFNNVVKSTLKVNVYYNSYAYNGAGVGVGDLNNDGLLDVYMAGNWVDDRIYLNKGDLQFEDVTEDAGIIEYPGYSTGVSMIDINQDGWLDIYVCRDWFKEEGKKNDVLFINNGDMTFTESAKEYGFDFDAFSTQANFFDYDNDGDLDCYVVTHPDDWNDKQKLKYWVKIEDGKNQSDFFFRNDNGKFVDVSKEAGINNHGYGLSATVGDINNDGWMDIYIANDFVMHDFLYINNGDGTFTDRAKEDLKRNSHFAMGADVVDVNNDGLLDIYTVDMDLEDNYTVKTFTFVTEKEAFEAMENGGYHSQYVGNALQLNNGNDHFTEIGRMSGVSTSSWSWSPLFADYDNDGDRDLFVSNGNGRDFHVDNTTGYHRLRRATRIGDSLMYEDLLKQYPTQALVSPNAMYENNGDLTFTDQRIGWGTYQPSASYGAAYADLDNDGDMDIIASNINESAFIYRNNSQDHRADNNWVRFELEGPEGNSAGFGARIEVESKGNSQFTQHGIVRGYMTTVDHRPHFGLGTAVSTVDRVSIIWPDGRQQVIDDLAANTTHKLKYSDAKGRVDVHNLSVLAASEPLFRSSTEEAHGIDFVHAENEFDDFDREYLVPHKLSYLGPGVAVADFNGDDLHDFAVGGAMDQATKVYTQGSDGKFTVSTPIAFESDASFEDMGLLAFDANGDGNMDLYIGSGGSEHTSGSEKYQDRLYFGDGNGGFERAADALPAMNTSTSLVSGTDFDQDGDMDLFVGTRLNPGSYPDRCEAWFLRNDGGTFADATAEWSTGMERAGMLTAAQFSDHDNDGDMDLIAVGEWTGLQVYTNEGGKLGAASNGGTDGVTGWWNSLTAGDFDSDGDMDYIAGNFGNNCKYKPDANGPIEVYADDFDENGTNDILMGYYQSGELWPVKSRERVVEQCPIIDQTHKNWDAYGKATLMDLFGEDAMKNARTHETASTFSTYYFSNNGDGTFSARPMNNELQISSVYGMLVADLNRDGNLDLVTHGNYYWPEVETNRQDASVGTVLLGKGDGTFEALNSVQSGFFSPLDAKSLAWIPIGRRNKLSVLGTNNNGPAMTFDYLGEGRTVMATAGDIAGMIEHRDGSRTRLEFPQGCGYLSQTTHPIMVPADAQRIKVIDASGNERLLWPSTQASR